MLVATLALASINIRSKVAWSGTTQIVGTPKGKACCGAASTALDIRALRAERVALSLGHTAGALLRLEVRYADLNDLEAADKVPCSLQPQQ